jgi:hypothetical protein
VVPGIPRIRQASGGVVGVSIKDLWVYACGSTVTGDREYPQGFHQSGPGGILPPRRAVETRASGKAGGRVGLPRWAWSTSFSFPAGRFQS